MQYLVIDRAYLDKKELFEYKLPFYDKNLNQLHFNIDKFEDYLESKKINIKRVDLIKKIKDVFKGRKVNGKYKGESCISWVIENPSNWVNLETEEIIMEAEDAEIVEEVKQITNES